MTGIDGERTQRSMSRPRPRPHGARPSPRPRQEPESRPSSRVVLVSEPGPALRVKAAPSAPSRLGSRAVVVAGFAGVAWLLAGGAAHAAAGGTDATMEPAEKTTGTTVDSGSLFQLLGQDEPALLTDVSGRLVTDLLGAVATTVATQPGPAAASTGTSADTTTRSANVAGQLIDPAPDAGVDGERTGLLNPLGLGDAVGSSVDLLTSLTGTADLLVAPKHGHRSGGAQHAASRAHHEAIPVAGAASVKPATSAAIAGHGARRHHAVTGHRMARAADSGDSAGASSAPARPLSVPQPAVPDAGFGGGASHASDTHQFGGAQAALPTQAADGRAAANRLTLANQVVVPAQLARTPTVSPD